MKKQIGLTLEKYLKRKKEIVVIGLSVRNYNKSNFYLALVYNEKIARYKILYIPIDLIEDDEIEDYACYQFIDMASVGYILETLDNAKLEYNFSEINSMINENISMYQIEITTNFSNESYMFLATRYIPKEWLFMFEIIVILFEHAPHILSGIFEDLLTLFKDGAQEIPYQESFEFELMRDDSNDLIKVLKGKKLSFDDIEYLEEVNNKYFAIISGHIVIIDYDKCGIISTYCDCSEYNDYVYTVIEAIREDIERKFSRIVVTDKDSSKVQYYLCYGVNSKGLKVIHGSEEKILPFSLCNDGSIKFVYDENKIESEVKEHLK